MRSTITARAQTVIPATIRHKLGLSPSDRLEWVVEGDMLRVISVQEDSIAAKLSSFTKPIFASFLSAYSRGQRSFSTMNPVQVMKQTELIGAIQPI
ncbi:MAG: hypothetical protein DSZ28_09210 [Thiothrix sp.]|nr:MAG: hypothetical protein DSZ28_09210 [Thiothrix sp.]